MAKHVKERESTFNKITIGANFIKKVHDCEVDFQCL